MAAWKCKQKLKKPFHFSVLSLKVGWGRLIQKILIRKNEFANHRNPNSYMVRFYYSISVLYLYPLSVCVTVNLTDTESAYNDKFSLFNISAAKLHAVEISACQIQAYIIKAGEFFSGELL